MKGIMTDENGNIIVRNGRLVIDDNRADIVQRILEAYPGEFKEQPLLGCYIKKQLNGTANPFWVSDAKRQLKDEGIAIEKMTVQTDNNIIITYK